MGRRSPSRPLAWAVLLARAARVRLRLALVQRVEPVSMMVDAPTPFARSFDDELSGLRRSEAKDYLEDLAEEVTASGAFALPAHRTSA